MELVVVGARTVEPAVAQDRPPNAKDRLLAVGDCFRHLLDLQWVLLGPDPSALAEAIVDGDALSDEVADSGRLGSSEQMVCSSLRSRFVWAK